MWQDWSLPRTNNEIRIMHQHAEITKLFTFYYAGKRNIKLLYYQKISVCGFEIIFLYMRL